MTDIQIIDLYLNRNETAIEETAKQYGSYCYTIAMNILHNKQDSDECVNDTYMKVWESIPPQQPKVFSTFIGAITRNISLNRYKMQNAQKRGGNTTTLLLSELTSCVPAARNVEDEIDDKALGQAINSFLDTIEKEDIAFFVSRYWYGYSVAQIAKQFNASQGKVKMNLMRTRNKLKIYLEKKGVF